MRAVARFGILLAVLATFAPASAEAIPIVVAEFRWDATLVDPGVTCEPQDPACDPIAATYLSTYSLTGLWDGPEPAPTVTGNVALGGGVITFDWLPISFDTGYFDQLGISDVLPASALTTIFFDFRGETLSLTALLDAPGFTTLQFEAPDNPPPTGVPEPGTLSLLGFGIIAGIAARRPRSRRRFVP